MKDAPLIKDYLCDDCSEHFEDLKLYFQQNSQDKILADWNKSKEFDKIGMTVEEFEKNNIIIKNKSKIIRKSNKK